MNDREFHSAFERAVRVSPDYIKQSVAFTKWVVAIPSGKLEISFPTNKKNSGLHPDFPGQFRPQIIWRNASTRLRAEVSLYQYLRQDECDGFCGLQIAAINKFADQSGDRLSRRSAAMLYEPERCPTVQAEPWCYYFDMDDVRAWGDYFGCLLPIWQERFNDAPESLADWLTRTTRAAQPTSDFLDQLAEENPA